MQRDAHIPQRSAFVSAVANLTNNEQRFIIGLYGGLHLAQVAVGKTQAAQHITFDSAVASLARYGQRFFIILYSPLVLAQILVALPKLPSALPSPLRLPISRFITNDCS